MPPRLAAISGKLKGAIFALNEESLIIGRETAANLCIPDASVSRRHSKIEKNDTGFVLSDLESLNGTFVNDVPVKSRLLEHGDRVRIGDSQFLFLMHEGDATSKSSDVRLDEAHVVSGMSSNADKKSAAEQLAAATARDARAPAVEVGPLAGMVGYVLRRAQLAVFDDVIANFA